MASYTPVDLSRLLGALSMALDFTTHGLSRHHRRVAYMAVTLGRAIALPVKTLKTLYCAASIHDIGAVTFAQKNALSRFEIHSPKSHCQLGRQMLASSPQLREVAIIIEHHHDHWDEPGRQDSPVDPTLLLLGDLIHLADRIEVLLTPAHILSQRRQVMDTINSLFGTVFRPEWKDLLNELAERESFWLDLDSPFIDELTRQAVGADEHIIQLPYCELKGLASIFARIIDSKSRFTLRHSRLVSASATLLSQLAGFSPADAARMEVASLLHDIGKLSIPEEILEKPAQLTPEEYLIIKQHTYHSYHILNQVPGFSEIAQWAAYHHERLDGKGYPFHIPGEELSVGSRIVAVADIFSALVEDRPYRDGLSREKVESILKKMVLEKAIDGDLADLLCQHYDDFEALKQTT
ncbi:metal-dependent phosphohydrolase, hd subdomain [Heliomicrobium modesticaldum Ice1]|uniref:Metal-dependent phosphohydrolase, hd subdomain n=1 Tax=Heliobacterium modesticaldum (strain ATCC 51547 / Ice1) TaxID=498761 RepID=B0TDX2_HELMI|nr:HD domain-containing phosphohydrolase [Heliomicrobium modesticaldum]ABZ82835.1 metal-dependent phosphohydrolase, hd subdomain [Heliomicrobium modesticaldum Ice1]